MSVARVSTASNDTSGQERVFVGIGIPGSTDARLMERPTRQGAKNNEYSRNTNHTVKTEFGGEPEFVGIIGVSIAIDLAAPLLPY